MDTQTRTRLTVFLLLVLLVGAPFLAAGLGGSLFGAPSGAFLLAIAVPVLLTCLSLLPLADPEPDDVATAEPGDQ